MSSAVADLETNLQAMLVLRPPGVSGSRINNVTSLCMANVQSESVLIQKIFTHFRKAPATHKLGVLYVVDSVTRKWLEQAKQQAQPVSNAAPDGTSAAGVNRVTELMPILMDDIISSAPQDQKDKIKKLVDIWEKGQTFPASMLESFKQKLSKNSTTPPGSPPPNLMASLNGARPNTAPSAAPVIPASLAQTLANLSKIAQQSSNAQPAPAPVPAPVAAPYSSGPPSSITAPPFMNSIQPGLGLPYLQTSQPAMPPAAAPAPPFLPPQAQSLPTFGNQNVAANAMNGLLPGVSAAPTGGADQMVELIKQLVARGLPADQIAAVVKALNPGAAQAAAPQANQGAYPMLPNGSGNGWAPPRPDDRNMRSPTNRARGRSRSRSPGRQWDHRESPRSGRDERRFGDFGGRNSPPRDRFDDRDRARPYRQRSPQGRRGSSPARGGEMPEFQENKHVEFDPSLPQGHIKVMSRTLFVGGVTCSEQELRNIFSRFGAVQTCIVNKDKRHAFVKMYTRRDAVTAKAGMEPSRTPDAQLRTRWGVGFGPRDCSDYQTGVSVIPIQKLTDADRKWMLTAAWGGSGGKPISHGMVVEEPDIEIGAGVSSKAISRRMQTDKGGSQGPKSSMHGRDNDDRNDRGGGGGGGGRHGGKRGGGGRDHGHGGRRDDHSNPNNDPVVPPFGYGVQVGQNGMPVFPPGFQFPAPDAINNPPY